MTWILQSCDRVVCICVCVHVEPSGMKHWSQGSTPGDMNDFDVHVVFTWPTGQSTHDMVCSFGFVSFGCSIDLFWPVHSTPMFPRRTMQNAAAAACVQNRKFTWKSGKTKYWIFDSRNMKSDITGFGWTVAIRGNAGDRSAKTKSMVPLGRRQAAAGPGTSSPNIKAGWKSTSDAHQCVCCDQTVFSLQFFYSSRSPLIDYQNSVF